MSQLPEARDIEVHQATAIPAVEIPTANILGVDYHTLLLVLHLFLLVII